MPRKFLKYKIISKKIFFVIGFLVFLGVGHFVDAAATCGTAHEQTFASSSDIKRTSQKCDTSADTDEVYTRLGMWIDSEGTDGAFDWNCVQVEEATGDVLSEALCYANKGETSPACTGEMPTGAEMCSGSDSGISVDTPWHEVTECVSTNVCEYTVTSSAAATCGTAHEKTFASSSDIKRTSQKCDTSADTDEVYTRLGMWIDSEGTDGAFDWNCVQVEEATGDVLSEALCYANKGETSPACTGEMPTGAEMCSGSDSGISVDTPWHEVTECVSTNVCEYTVPEVTDVCGTMHEATISSIVGTGLTGCVDAEAFITWTDSDGSDGVFNWTCNTTTDCYAYKAEDDDDDEDADMDEDDTDGSIISKVRDVILKFAGKKYDADDDKTMHVKRDEIKFTGQNEELAGGEAVLVIDSDEEDDDEIEDDGSWKLKCDDLDEGKEEITIKLYDKDGYFIDKERYTVRVDTEDPTIEIPDYLVKRPGQVLWWTAEDNYKIKKTYIYWNGKKHKLKVSGIGKGDPVRQEFIIPADTPSGTYNVRIKTYDKAKNKTIKDMTVMVTR